MGGLSTFCSRAVLAIALVNLINGFLYGYIIGYVPVYNQYDRINENCTQFSNKEACESLSFTKCAWNDNLSICSFDDADCSSHNDSDTCSEEDACYYDFKKKQCLHTIGFDDIKLGIFAAAMTVGGMFGSAVGGPLVSRVGQRKTLIISAFLALVACITLHIARFSHAYALVVIGRLLTGVFSGVACVVSPMYVEEMAPAPVRGPLGTLFQVAVTFGIFFVAALGYLIEPSDFNVEQINELRIHIIIGIQTLFAIVTLLISFLMRENPRDQASKEETSGLLPNEAPSLTEELNEDTQTYTWREMWHPLLIAVVLCLAQQMTGINAIMNYAPSMTDKMGLAPMLGNMTVMAWNFVTTLLAIPIASRVSFRNMFLCGTLVASLSCLITGVPVLPDVGAGEDLRKVLSGFGIFLFILAFEVGMGPALFVLCQQLFPTSFRPKGASFALSFLFIFNIIINVFFPMAVTNLSGGPNENQDKGMAITFFFFAACGLLSLAVLYKGLYPFRRSVVVD